MITFLRFFLVLSLAAFSSVFMATLLTCVILRLDGNFDFEIDLFYRMAVWSAGGMLTLIVLGGSVLADPVIRLFFPLRRMSVREEKIVSPALQNVRQHYRQKYGRDLKAQVLVIDAPHIEGFTVGRSTIAVSKGLLANASEDEITGILAHEVGHLHYRDGTINFMQMLSWVPLTIVTRILRGAIPDGDFMNYNPGAVRAVFWLAVLVILPQMFMLWVVSFPVLWLAGAFEKMTLWPVEYRADRFACNLGLGAGLMSLFERLDIQDIRNNHGFLSAYAWSHPPTALRIDKIEQRLVGRASLKD